MHNKDGQDLSDEEESDIEGSIKGGDELKERDTTSVEDLWG